MRTFPHAVAFGPPNATGPPGARHPQSRATTARPPRTKPSPP